MGTAVACAHLIVLGHLQNLKPRPMDSCGRVVHPFICDVYESRAKVFNWNRIRSVSGTSYSAGYMANGG